MTYGVIAVVFGILSLAAGVTGIWKGLDIFAITAGTASILIVAVYKLWLDG